MTATTKKMADDSSAALPREGNRQRGGRGGRGRGGGPYRRHWGGRGGGRGGRGGRGGDLRRKRGGWSYSVVHRDEKLDVRANSADEPQDQSGAATYDKCMTAMLKKQLGIGGGGDDDDDAARFTNASTVLNFAPTSPPATADASKQCADNKQHSAARPKPKQKKHPKPKPPKHSNQQEEKEHGHRSSSNRHHPSDDAPPAESTALPSPDHPARFKRHDKKRQSPARSVRPARPKPNQKIRSEISAQEGKENVCNHDSNKLSSAPSAPSAPSKFSRVDTAAHCLKPKHEKSVSNSGVQRGKESQRKNQRDGLPNATKASSSEKAADADIQQVKENLEENQRNAGPSDETRTYSSDNFTEKRDVAYSAGCDASNVMDTAAAAAGSVVDTSNAHEQPETEKERTNRLLREAREKSAAAREKKKSKRSKKHETRLREQEAEKARRAKSWQEKIAKDKETVDLMSQLIVAELLRQNKNRAPSLTKEEVLRDSHASRVVTKESENANDSIYGGLKCRVRVASLDRQDLVGRQGTLRHWNAEREKFCIGLDTKKAADSDVHYLFPENLEAVPAPRAGKADKKLAQSYEVEIEDLFGRGSDGVGCRFALEKYDVDALRSVESIEVGLLDFSFVRTENERLRRLEEEEERRREEEHRRQEELDRKRRAERRAKERAERERARERHRREREESARAEWQRRRAQARREQERGLNGLRMKLIMLRAMAEGVSPEDLLDFLEMEGCDDFDSDDEDIFESYADFFADAEDEYEKQARKEKEEENREMAEILGVGPDADERTLKVTYRKLALKFHPDKWRSESDHGMTREESLEHFQAIQNAYDHLMSRFDDEDGDDD